MFQNRCVTGKNIAGSKPMADLHTKKKVYFNNLEKKKHNQSKKSWRQTVFSHSPSSYLILIVSRVIEKIIGLTY